MFAQPNTEYIKTQMEILDPENMDRLDLITNIKNIAIFNSSAFFTYSNMLGTNEVNKLTIEKMKEMFVFVKEEALGLMETINELEEVLELEKSLNDKAEGMVV